MVRKLSCQSVLACRCSAAPRFLFQNPHAEEAQILSAQQEYEDDDEAVVQAEIDSSGREEENLQPYFSRNRGQTSFEFGGEIDNHEEDDNEDGDSSWNLRKCSGYALDQIATACGERGLESQLLSILLPLINSKMQVYWTLFTIEYSRH